MAKLKKMHLDEGKPKESDRSYFRERDVSVMDYGDTIPPDLYNVVVGNIDVDAFMKAYDFIGSVVSVLDNLAIDGDASTVEISWDNADTIIGRCMGVSKVSAGDFRNFVYRWNDHKAAALALLYMSSCDDSACHFIKEWRDLGDGYIEVLVDVTSPTYKQGNLMSALEKTFGKGCVSLRDAQSILEDIVIY